MKKIIALATILILFSCKKSEETCNCGLITDDNVNDYSVTIRNSCTNNTKKFYLTRGDWVNAFVGSNYCITNSGVW
jgi:hypothetical protein